MHNLEYLEDFLDLFFTLFADNGIKTAIRKLSNANLEFATLKVTNPHEYVFHVQLNRPEKRNAMNPKFFE